MSPTSSVARTSRATASFHRPRARGSPCRGKSPSPGNVTVPEFILQGRDRGKPLRANPLGGGPRGPPRRHVPGPSCSAPSSNRISCVPAACRRAAGVGLGVAPSAVILGAETQKYIFLTGKTWARGGSPPQKNEGSRSRTLNGHFPQAGGYAPCPGLISITVIIQIYVHAYAYYVILEMISRSWKPGD